MPRFTRGGPRRPITRLAATIPVVILSLVVSACATNGSTSIPTTAPSTVSPPASPQARFPVTIEAANGPVEIAERPTRVVSLSPTATEMLFAIDAGDQVVAVDDQSNYPPEAPLTDLSGFQPNVEAIAGFEPDLVVISNDTNDLVKSLEALSIPVLLQPAPVGLDGTYGEIQQLGLATGRIAESTALIESMKQAIEGLVASVSTPDTALTYYHELDPTYFTATSTTFIGQMYSLVGLQNIADAAKGAASGYPQLSAEYIIHSNPDIIALADTKCCGQSLQTVADRPGWDGISAVQHGAVLELDDDVVSRWGPRVVDFLQAVVEQVAELQAAAAA
ncbi:MAG TPA: ABC transporter substrate-binding protein [Actinomycetota bacterium]|nr:ABC transporter substrate-binding protein [Actinomycetota bacterium]